MVALHGVVGLPGGLVGGFAADAIGRVPIRIDTGETKFDLGVGCLGPRVVRIGIGAAEIGIEHVDLGLDLGVRDVLGAGLVDHIDHHGNRHHGVDPELRVGHVLPGEFLNAIQLFLILGVLLEQPFEVAHGVAGALLGEERGHTGQQDGTEEGFEVHIGLG